MACWPFSLSKYTILRSCVLPREEVPPEIASVRGLAAETDTLVMNRRELTALSEAHIKKLLRAHLAEPGPPFAPKLVAAKAAPSPG